MTRIEVTPRLLEQLKGSQYKLSNLFHIELSLAQVVEYIVNTVSSSDIPQDVFNADLSMFIGELVSTRLYRKKRAFIAVSDTVALKMDELFLENKDKGVLNKFGMVNAYLQIGVVLINKMFINHRGIDVN